MGEANEGRRSKAMDDLSLQMDKYPRDLRQRFMACSTKTQPSLYSEAREDSEEIELSLGLSLGGRFGVDKNAKKLMRSSSIVGTMPFVREDVDYTTPSPAPARAYSTTLMRTSSLPVETEEHWRKRKEMQTLRRMEAKRRRSEKQRNSKTERDGGSGGAGGEDEVVGGATVSQRPFGLPSRDGSSACNARQVQVVLGDVLANGKVGFQGYAQPSSQGSADTQGGSSSGMSEMESKIFQDEFNQIMKRHTIP